MKQNHTLSFWYQVLILSYMQPIHSTVLKGLIFSSAKLEFSIKNVNV